MAVQAQYPSNVLLFNRNGQEGKNVLGIDYSLQPQPGGGGGFVDQSHMLFNNGVAANPRKRAREVATAATTAANNINMTPFSFSLQNQQQPLPQLIDLTQLQNHHHHQQQQPNVVSTGLRLSFGEQLQQGQQQQQLQQQQQHNLPSQSSVLLSLLSDDFANQIKQQSEELNQFILAQGQQLRRTLAEKRQRHYRALLGAAEETVARRLREKEAEVEKATRRNEELEARAAQLNAEAQAWQVKARAQEAQAASLHAQLQQAMMSGGVGGGCGQHQESDGNSAGGGGGAEAEDAESAYIDPERVNSTSGGGGGGPSCKACRKRAASVVLLPCRHLCVCTQCDPLVEACPLCLSLRNGGVQVFLT
ncbi:hypothetical protein Ancab_032925 [Ancistrocladus abbreviatus]